MRRKVKRKGDKTREKGRQGKKMEEEKNRK